MAEDISQLLTRGYTLIKKLEGCRRYRRCSEDVIKVEINIIFQKYGVKREAYHGGQVNGVCIMRLVADSGDIIHEFFILLKGCSRGCVTGESSEQVCRIHAKLLCQIDCAFSLLRKFGPIRESMTP